MPVTRELKAMRDLCEKRLDGLLGKLRSGEPKSYEAYREIVGQIAAYDVMLADIERKTKDPHGRDTGEEIE